MNNLTITELIDINCLQLMQDSFSEFTGITISAFDPEGDQITKNKTNTRLCEEMVKCSENGAILCREFDKKGIIKAIDERNAVLRTCHAGLSSIIVPIYFDGKIIGLIRANQFHTDTFDPETVRINAAGFTSAPDKLIETVSKTPYISNEQVEKIKKYLCGFSNALSVMAQFNHNKINKHLKAERISRSQSELITNLTKDLSFGMREWLDDFRFATEKYNDVPEVKYETDSLLAKAQEVYAVINGSVDYIHMSDGKAEYSENIYDIRKLIQKCTKSFQDEALKNNINVTLDINNTLPERLAGNSGRIGQMISKLGKEMIKNTGEGGQLKISVSNKTTTYSCDLIIEMTGTRSLINSEIIEKCEKIIKSGGVNIFKMENNPKTIKFDFPIIVLLTKQMSGKIKISSSDNENVNFIITIPQLDGTRKNA